MTGRLRRPAGKSLASRDVALLWSATVFDSGATWVIRIVIFVRILEQYSTSALAMVELVGILPSLLLMPLAGSLADRYNARRLSLLSMATQMTCLAALLLVFHHGPATVAALYALLTVSNALWQPARQVWLYRLVEPSQYTAVNATIGSVQGLMTVIGAAAGGVLTAWNPDLTILLALAAQTCAGIGTLIARYPAATGTTPAEPGARSLLRDARDGVRLVNRYPLARSIIWVGMAWGLISGGFNVLIAGLALKELHSGSGGLGLFYVVDGTAVVIGSWCTARLRRAGHLPGYALAYVAQGAFWALTFAAGNVTLGLLLFGVMRLASGVIIALDTTILLETVPDSLRGRVTSLHMTTYNAVSQLSLALISGLLAVVDIQSVGIATGVLSTAVGALWWITTARRAHHTYLTAAQDIPPRPVATPPHAE
ncbi:MFS transporter [Streptomyces sp. S465]|uniref:MFS transporter n=1 Tax=Streptomyces sp. S465 TaxID=2979468 RepID=UPI0022A8B8DB|nr:MFS transporter [Streptomyces sp. S465]WAP54940.1 MFS transporter [Streptomyces sp. S465]